MLTTSVFILTASIVCTLLILPKVIGVARYRELLDKPNNRSSHIQQVPRLGGVAFYITLMLSFYFMQRTDQAGLIHSIIPCLTILFVVGLKDDLVVLTAKSKFVTQLVVATFLIFDPDLEIRSLHGFLNLHDIHPVFSILLLYIIITGIINAINLVDGIDGLASILGIVALSFLALAFYQTGKYFSFLFMISMVGSLIGFLPFNLSKKNKIFMGDTGSLLLGFVIAYGCVRMLTLETYELYQLHLPLPNIPFLLIFIVFIPVMDTIRVMTVRLLRGRGPFKPDRTHLHHFFLDTYGWSHLKTSLVMGALAILITLGGYLLCQLVNYLVLFGFLLLFYISSVYLTHVERKRKIAAVNNHRNTSKIIPSNAKA